VVLAVRCSAGREPYLARMKYDQRFELLMSSANRRALDAIADEFEVSASDLVRMSIRRLIKHPDEFFGLRSRVRREEPRP
jgi:hypothetical protein